MVLDPSPPPLIRSRVSGCNEVNKYLSMNVFLSMDLCIFPYIYMQILHVERRRSSLTGQLLLVHISIHLFVYVCIDIFKRTYIYKYDIYVMNSAARLQSVK